jgi:hypothetical protein
VAAIVPAKTPRLCRRRLQWHTETLRALLSFAATFLDAAGRPSQASSAHAEARSTRCHVLALPSLQG